MTTRPRLVSTRRVLLAACGVAALAAMLAVTGDSAQAGSAVGPDVTVFSFTDIHSYGSTGGFAAYAIGTNACNRGDTPLNWCESGGCAAGVGDEDHPVIAQNLYRLKSGRFEQIGMSWLKHGFSSLNGSSVSCTGAAGQSCQPPPAGSTQLGVGCIDPYVGSTNGTRAFMGPRSEVNAATGVFPYPPSFPPGPFALYDQRIKVATADLEAVLNPGASYWAEAHYVASDDASASNAYNNASHRRVTVGASPSYTLTMTGSFLEGQPAIFAWQAQDASVEVVDVDVPAAPVQRFHVARKVTDLGGGTWHYEYAIHNLNSDRSARAFTVEFPTTTSFTNVGFKDIEHHSGEPYAVDDWSVFSFGGLLVWSTDTFASDPNANALRWATMFNFWFDANEPPAGIVHTLELFKPGSPAAIEFGIGNGIFSDGFESGATGAWGAVQ
jgi:hypothetical protein